MPELGAPDFYLILGVILTVLGAVALAAARDRLARLVRMNVMGSGSLLVLVALAARSPAVEPLLTR